MRCGCVLTNWADDADGLLAARVPEGADPAMLLIGGRARPRARYPETGTLTYRSTTDVKWMNSTNGGWNRPLTHEELTRVVVNPADFPKNMDVRNAEITVFHEWDESTVRVRSLDRKTGLVELESELEHPAGSFGKREYVLWNVREGMTRPGQWYFDRTRGLIVYRPMSGESADNLDAEIPVSLHAFLLKGARNVVIRNLNIRCVNTHHEKSELRAVNCPGAIEGTDCENVLIDGVRLSDVAGTGIKFLRSREIDVRHCRISDCGAGGKSQAGVRHGRLPGGKRRRGRVRQHDHGRAVLRHNVRRRAAHRRAQPHTALHDRAARRRGDLLLPRPAHGDSGQLCIGDFRTSRARLLF